MLSVVGVYQPVLDQLADLDREVARGAQVRARARWVEDGDSSSAYFLRLEKKRGADRKISALSGTARRKAPGLNGVPMEFYLHFWDILGDHLVAVLLSSILKLVYFDS